MLCKTRDGGGDEKRLPGDDDADDNDDERRRRRLRAGQEGETSGMRLTRARADAVVVIVVASNFAKGLRRVGSILTTRARVCECELVRVCARVRAFQ